MDLKTIHLMRHGEVDNPEGILYERLDSYHLSELGKQMAQATADYLQVSGESIDLLMASPLERAQESAAPIAKAFKLQIASDERLIEASNTFAGLAVSAHPGRLAHPKYWARYRNPLRPSWGEPYRDQVRRMKAAVSGALKRLDSQNSSTAVLVSHQLPIWCLRRWVESKTLVHNPRKRECALASLTTLFFDQHTLIGWDYVSPASDLLAQARDVTPGSSSASTHREANK